MIYKFIAAYGDIDREVTVDFTNGFVITLYIEGKKFCTILKHTTGWSYIFKRPYLYNSDDVDALDDIISEFTNDIMKNYY